MNPGDLVQEMLPLMAGDAPQRIGLVIEPPAPLGKSGSNLFVKVLFDRKEMVPYNSLKKLET
jgi:hypothetical protein